MVLTPVLLAVWATSKGPGLTPDSVNYLVAGARAADGRALADLHGGAWTGFPPGLPMVVALAERAGVDGQMAVRWFVACASAVLVLLAYALAFRTLTDRSASLMVAGFVAVSPALLGVTAWAFTEVPFTAMALAFLLLLADACTGSPMPRNRLIRLGGGLVALCWLAFSFRYVGVTLIATGVLVLLLRYRPCGWRRAVLTAGAFGAAASIVPVLWMIRNHRTDGTFLGQRMPSTADPISVLRDLVETVGLWVLPTGRFPILLLGAGTLVAGWLAIVAVHPSLRSKQEDVGGLGDRDELTRWSEGSTSPTFVLATFTLVYLGYLTFARLTTSFDDLNRRLLFPAYVPLVILFAVAARSSFRWSAGRRPSFGRLKGPLLLGFLAWAAVHAAVAVIDGRSAAADGLGYNAARWTESSLAAGLLVEVENLGPRSSPPLVLSNEPYPLWSATQIDPVLLLPMLNTGQGPAEIEVESLFSMVLARACVDQRAVLLAMYESTATPTRPERSWPRDDRRSMVLVGSYEDGVLYRLAVECD